MEKKKTKKSGGNLFLENYGLGYPSQEEFEKWLDEQEEQEEEE